MKRIRERRAVEQKCTLCEEPAVSKEFCADHLAERQQYDRIRYRTRVEQGLCTKCGRPATGTLCDTHRKSNRASKEAAG